MDSKGEISKVACLTFRRMLPGPIEKVWAHLTETKLMASWFGEDSHIEPKQGGTVRIMGGHVRGTVTQWQPPSRLVYTWNVFDPGDGPDAVSAYPESYPTFELEARDSDVELTFRHFPIMEHMIPQSAMGWHSMLDILTATLHGESITDRSMLTTRNAELYGVDLDKLAR